MGKKQKIKELTKENEKLKKTLEKSQVKKVARKRSVAPSSQPEIPSVSDLQKKAEKLAKTIEKKKLAVARKIRPAGAESTPPLTSAQSAMKGIPKPGDPVDLTKIAPETKQALSQFDVSPAEEKGPAIKAEPTPAPIQAEDPAIKTQPTPAPIVSEEAAINAQPEAAKVPQGIEPNAKYSKQIDRQLNKNLLEKALKSPTATKASQMAETTGRIAGKVLPAAGALYSANEAIKGYTGGDVMQTASGATGLASAATALPQVAGKLGLAANPVGMIGGYISGLLGLESERQKLKEQLQKSLTEKYPYVAQSRETDGFGGWNKELGKEAVADFATFLGDKPKEMSEVFKKSPELQQYKRPSYNTDLFRQSGLHNLSDEELLDSAVEGKIKGQPSRDPSSVVKINVPKGFIPPSKKSISDAIEEFHGSLNLGQRIKGSNKNLYLAQVGRESNYKIGTVGRNNDGSIPEDAARGLFQVKEAAFQEALRHQNKLLKQGRLSAPILDPNKNYSAVMNNAENWKDQLAAGMLYHSKIADDDNPDGDIREQLVKFQKGPSMTYAKALQQYQDAKSKNPKTKIEDPEFYFNDVLKKQKSWEDEDIQSSGGKLSAGYREPSTVLTEYNPSEGSPQELGIHNNVIGYLRAKTDEEKEIYKNRLFPNLNSNTSPEEKFAQKRDIERMERLRGNVIQNNLIPEEDKPIELADDSAPSDQPPVGEEDSSDVNKLKALMELYKSSRNNLYNAEKDIYSGNQLRLLDALNTSFQDIGRGISMAKSGVELQRTPESKVGTAFADTLDKQRQELAKIEEKDPNSFASRSATEALNSLLEEIGMPKVQAGTMSKEDIEKFSKHPIDIYEAKTRRNYVDSEKKRSNDIKLENQVNKRFDTLNKVPVERIEGAGRTLNVLNMIRRGEIKGAQNIREQLNAEVNALLLPAGMRPSVSSLNRTQIDTYYGRFKDLVSKIIASPTDTISDAYLQQIEKEVRMLQSAYQDEAVHKTKSLIKGTKEEYAKDVLKGRISEYVPDFEQRLQEPNESPKKQMYDVGTDSDAAKWARENINSKNPEDRKTALEILDVLKRRKGQ